MILILLMPVIGISAVEKTYILSPEKNSIKIRFPDLTKEYNLKDEAIKDGVTSKDLCKIEKTIYKGDGIISLKAYQDVTKEKIKSSYDCNCKNVENEIINNLTGEKITEIIEVCDTCYIYENYVISELIEINPETFKIDKNTEIYEVFEGCSKIEKLDNGKWGCSVFTNVSILGVEIKGATWWNSSWTYKQEINLSNTAGVLTDYQAKITLNTTNFNYSHANATGKDIRFTNSSDNSLDYWIESWNSTGDSIIWVEVNSLANATNTTIYMYYGNNVVDSESNGNNTFIIFNDGFLSGWNQGPEGSTIVNGKIRIATGTGNYFSSNISISRPSILEFEAQDSDGLKGNILGLTEVYNAYSRQGTHKLINFHFSSNTDLATHFGSPTSTFVKIGTHDTNTYDYKIIWGNDGSETEFYRDGVQNTSPASNFPDSTNLYIYFGSHNNIASSQKDIDDIRVRKYASPEPTYTIGAEETKIIYPTLNWTYQPDLNFTVEENPTFLFNMTNVNVSTVIFYHGLNDTATGNMNKSFRYFKDSYILRSCNRDEGDDLSEDNAIKYYEGDIGSYGSHRYDLNLRPIIQDSGDNWVLFNFSCNYHHLLENHIPVDKTNLTGENKSNQYLEIWKDNPAIIKLRTFPLETNRGIHLNINIDDQDGVKPLKIYVCNDSINPETVNPTIDNNCGFFGTKLDFDVKDRIIRNSSYLVLHFGINSDGYINLNGGVKATDEIYIILDSDITPIDKSYKLYFANDTGFNDTYLMFEGSAGWTFTNRSETPDVFFDVSGDNDTVVYYVHGCNTSDACVNFSLQIESYVVPNQPPTTPNLLTPVTSEKINGTYNITWLDGIDAEGDYFNVTILLYWNGVLNHTLANNNITNGTQYYEWNTTGFNDSDLYEIIIYSTDSGGLSSDTTTSGYFEIDNISVFPIATYSKRLYFYSERLFFYS